MIGIVFLAAFMLIGSGPAVQEANTRSVDELAWLAGCWASVAGEEGSGEQWTVPAGGTMFGVSRTVRNSDTVAFEFMQIRNVAEQNVEFIAKPSGQVEAAFVAIGLSEGEVVFENLGHDFPQRIIYSLRSTGSLEVRIEGEVDGESRTVTFPFIRIACGATP